MTNDNRIMGIDELAEYLQMSRSTLYKLSQAGRIPCQKIGRYWRYNREFIDEWIATFGKPDEHATEYGAQLAAPSAGQQDNDDLKRYFSVRQVRLLGNSSIHSISDLLLSLATNKGKSDLVEALDITPEQLDGIATRVTEDLQANRTGGQS